jgi:hypothetical protein
LSSTDPGTGLPPAGAPDRRSADASHVEDARGVGRFTRVYADTAIVVLNTIVLLVVLNLVLFAYYRYKDARLQRMAVEAGEAQDPAVKYGKELVATVYEGWTEPQLDTLMAESWGRPMAYEPFTQFRERAVRGRYVNIDARGYRWGGDQPPWPPRPEAFNIFFFGGSTTFGYGLPDDQTIPAYLQAALEARSCNRAVAVYNFGRGFYYSSQERALFERLLTSGVEPDLAIFLDGLNDYFYRDDVPSFTEPLVAVMNGEAGKLVPATDRLTHRIPITRAASAVMRRLAPAPVDTPSTATAGAARDEGNARAVTDRWFRNRAVIEATGERFGVPTFFVIQPVPTYGYDLAYHPFAEDGLDTFKDHAL